MASIFAISLYHFEFLVACLTHVLMIMMVGNYYKHASLSRINND
jgi:hypothetical protein